MGLGEGVGTKLHLSPKSAHTLSPRLLDLQKQLKTQPPRRRINDPHIKDLNLVWGDLPLLDALKPWPHTSLPTR